MTRLLAAALTLLALSSGVREYRYHEADKTREATQTVKEDRSSFAECGAYTVVITGHDAASTDDARKAAFAYFDHNCREVGTGTHPKF